MLDTTPQISVFIPTYNRLNLLKRAVNSVFECGAPVHLHVLDNCSTDGTDQWLREISTKSPITMQITRHRVNRGANVNFSAGFDSVRTPYLVPLADDDELVPGFLSKALVLAAENPDVIAVIGARAVRKKGSWHAHWDSRRSTGLLAPKINITEFLRYGHHATWSAMLWRTQNIQTRNLFQQAAQFGLPSDVYFQFSAFMSAPVYVEPLPAATFNVVPGQGSSKIGLTPGSIRDLGALADSIRHELYEIGFMCSESEVERLLSETVKVWSKSIKHNRELAIASGQQLDLDQSFYEYTSCLLRYVGFESFPLISEITALNNNPTVTAAGRIRSVLRKMKRNLSRKNCYS